jgi:photosystem I subunit 3
MIKQVQKRNLFINNFLRKNFVFLLLLFGLFQFQPSEVKADYAQLTPCKESVSFDKRFHNSLKKIEKRLQLYAEKSPEANSLTKEKQAIQTRFDRYKKSNLLCGKEGLPRIISTGEFQYSNQFVIPGFFFLYITGWIGWVGRKYLHYAQSTENPFENEIILHLPKAISFMNSGFLWPVEAWKEFLSGDLIQADEQITKSPR